VALICLAALPGAGAAQTDPAAVEEYDLDLPEEPADIPPPPEKAGGDPGAAEDGTGAAATTPGTPPVEESGDATPPDGGGDEDATGRGDRDAGRGAADDSFRSGSAAGAEPGGEAVSDESTPIGAILIAVAALMLAALAAWRLRRRAQDDRSGSASD
jgi:hypothetical protein